VETDCLTPTNTKVRVYDIKRGRRLVAAIEIVSLANKVRLEHRRTFVANAPPFCKRESRFLLSTCNDPGAYLYADLMDLIGQPKSSPGSDVPLYAVACRPCSQERALAARNVEQPLTLNQPLPTLPLWLSDDLAVPLDLEESYEETCRILRLR